MPILLVAGELDERARTMDRLAAAQRPAQSSLSSPDAPTTTP